MQAVDSRPRMMNISGESCSDREHESRLTAHQLPVTFPADSTGRRAVQPRQTPAAIGGPDSRPLHSCHVTTTGDATRRRSSFQT